MRRTRMAVAVLAMSSMVAASIAIAQQEQTTPQSGAAPAQMGPMGGMMMGGTQGGMASGGMAMCQQMMAGGMACPHEAMKDLAAKASASFAALEKEQDATLRKTKLAELGTLLNQLQAKAQEKCPMMGDMKGGEQKK